MCGKAKWAACLAGFLAVANVAWIQPPQKQGGAEPESPAFGVARRGTATIDDAYRQFLSLAVSHGRVKLEQDEDELSFEEVTVQLDSLCIIDHDWLYGPDTCLRRDVLATMSASYLGCRPGLVTGLFGMTRRYAQREMLYRGIIGPGAPATLVSGSELLSVITRVSRRADSNRAVKLNDSEIH